ncbi:MAG: alpha-N-arabinofuranosidase, partial [Treponema sp.]|nr:alpha-N-arabinofuranosidase [Treponema sp.]
SKSGAKKQYLVTVANVDAETSKEIEISFAHLEGAIKSATATVVTGEKMDTINSFENGDAVTEKSLSVKIIDEQTVSINLGAYSVAAITVLA